MKKALGIVLTSVLVLALAGCGAKTADTATITTTTEGVATYKDGTYDAKMANEKTGYDQAVVTIKDGKIENVDLKRLDDESQEVDYAFFDGKKAPNLKEYKQDLAKAIIEKQSADVDTISGATLSTAGWKQAVSDALVKASE